MKKTKHTYMRRDERLRDILCTALGQYQRKQKTFTANTMAKWTGLAYSSKLKNMLDQLVSEGYFDKEERVHRNSLTKDGNRLIIMKHVYSFTQETLNGLALL